MQALGGGLGEACKAAGTLLVVDTVAALGGVPFLADAWGIDAAYTGSQKCLSAPPGAAPLFLGERAMAKLKGRQSKPATYNLDLNLIGDYWGWFGKRRWGGEWTGWGDLQGSAVAARTAAPSGVPLSSPHVCLLLCPPPTRRLLQLPSHRHGVHVVRDARGAGDRGG
jgi:hypothetical protein